MKSVACLICTFAIALIYVMPSNADYDKQKVEVALGEFLAINDALEVLSNTECGSYISIDYKKHNVRDEAKKHLNDNDYNGFLMMLDSENYRMSQNNILQTIKNGIIKKKIEGLGTEQACADLAKKVEQTYKNVLKQWNEQKVLYGK